MCRKSKNEKCNNELKKSTILRHILIGSNIISELFFLWVFYFIVVLKRSKDLKDLCFLLKKVDTTSYNDELLEKNWKDEKKRAFKLKTLPLIRRAIYKTYGCLFILNGIWKLIWSTSLWFGAYWLLKQTIDFVRAKSQDNFDGHMYAIGMFIYFKNFLSFF